MKLQQTTNYDLFVSNPLQRGFKPQHVGVLAARMKKEGFKPSCAISVSKLPNGKLQNNTGHHRVPAARIAGVPVWYIIEHAWTAEELVGEGVTAKSWNAEAAAQTFAHDGDWHYEMLLHYVKRGIPLRMAASTLRGEHAASGNSTEFVKNGNFKVKDKKSIKHTEQVCSTIEELSNVSPECKSLVFISALSALLLVPEFSLDQLVHKVKLSPQDLIKSKTREQMLELIEGIYNRQSRLKLNISFLAKRALAERNAATKTKKP
jgi:hypothetical protein